MEDWNLENLQWTRFPASCRLSGDSIEITTCPHTDLWQRTYYHFRNDNAPVLQMETEEPYFSFTVRADYTNASHRFDQCGIVVYLDAENWLKSGVEYGDDRKQYLGSVVTNGGWSDWATTEIGPEIKQMWYRLSRRKDDFRIECSLDGETFHQMRIAHLDKAKGKISFGLYACSPEDSSFIAGFTKMKTGACVWQAHNGQPPEGEWE